MPARIHGNPFFSYRHPHLARYALLLTIFGGIGALTLGLSSASTFVAESEAEAGAKAGCIEQVDYGNDDTTVSGKAAVRFGGCAVPPPPPPGEPVYGAVLPISYDLASLTGTVRFVATDGNDTSGTGSQAAPYATLSKAVSVAAANDTIVVRGGTYRQGNLTLSASKSVRIKAYPGEIPVFNGAQAVTGGWTDDGGLRSVAYTPQPVTNGSGISFTTGQNLTGDGIGKHPDQAWVGSTQLRQVSAKTAVVDGTFWVDSANGRLYMTATDVGKGNIEVSQRDRFMYVNAPNTLVEGLRITRFSNSADDYGVLLYATTADNSTVRHVEVSESAFISVHFSGSDDLNKNSKMQNVSITTSNWMGVGAVYTDDFVMDAVRITKMNQFGEFTSSPQSGALKTSRTLRTKVLNSDISNNANHALWFDQSNYDAHVANNRIVDNGGSAVFYEISDRLTLVNNYIKATGAAQGLRLAGSSGLRVVNNTIVGGAAPFGVYTDNRSKPGCSDPAQPLCTDSYGSDRDTIRPHLATMDWMPRIDLMLNNIIAYSTGACYAGAVSPFCLTLNNDQALTTVDKVFHKAETARGIPQTVVDGNVYANGTSRIIRLGSTDYTTTTAFAAAMAGAPVGISGFESKGLYGNSYVGADGTPTQALADKHGDAAPVPTDAAVNLYLPAGTKHYGVTYK